jgi:hypothetical protein
MGFDQEVGTALDLLSIKTRGESLKGHQPTVLSCGGVHFSYNNLPSQPLYWKDIMALPGMDLSQRLFGSESLIRKSIK